MSSEPEKEAGWHSFDDKMGARFTIHGCNSFSYFFSKGLRYKKNTFRTTILAARMIYVVPHFIVFLAPFALTFQLKEFWDFPWFVVSIVWFCTFQDDQTSVLVHPMSDRMGSVGLWFQLFDFVHSKMIKHPSLFTGRQTGWDLYYLMVGIAFGRVACSCVVGTNVYTELFRTLNET